MSGVNEDNLMKLLGELTQEVKELKSLSRFQIQPLLETILSPIFDNHKQIRAYELTDGVKGSREIGDITGVNFSTITRWWNKWVELGIVVKVGNQFKKKYSLLDLVTIQNKQDWLFSEELGEDENTNK